MLASIISSKRKWNEMLAFSNDYYGLIFRATQSVELFCAYLSKDSVIKNEAVFLLNRLIYIIFFHKNFSYNASNALLDPTRIRTISSRNTGVWQLNNVKSTCRPYKTCFFYVNFLYMLFSVIVWYNKGWGGITHESSYTLISSLE